MRREHEVSSAKAGFSSFARRCLLVAALAIILGACALGASEQAGAERTRASGAAAALLACEHDTCTIGTPLDPTCSDCAANVCAVDPFCCETAWDATCVSEAETICDLDCTPGTCSHGKCTTGEPLDPSCGTCEAAICANDPFCCETAWDAICVAQVQTVCGSNECQGTCTHDKCTEGGPLAPSCGQCEATICAADPFCCETAWDAVCVAQVETLCGESCPLASSLAGASPRAAGCNSERVLAMPAR